MQCSRLRQIEDVITNADPVEVELVIPQPKSVKTYYSVFAKIDQHNRCRQDSLNLEKKLGTQTWDMRANLGIFEMCVVDAWLCYKGLMNTRELQEDFYLSLAEELIDNNYDGRVLRSEGGTPRSVGGRPRDCYGTHVVPIRRTKKGSKTITSQLRCRMCGKKTTHMCSECEDPIIPLCSVKTGRDCVHKHFDETQIETHIDETPIETPIE